MKFQISVILVGFLAFPSLILGSPDVKSEDDKGKFFLKSYQTTTITTLSIVVTTVPYFCAQTVADVQPCIGRRLRRKKRLSIPELEKSKTIDLEKSTGDGDEKDVSSDKDLERLFFTLWQSTTTTVTITSTATNTSITLSALASCTFANYNVPLC